MSNFPKEIIGKTNECAKCLAKDTEKKLAQTCNRIL